MDKDDIKKALECCYDSRLEIDCSDCPYHNENRCNDTLCKDALDLVTKQEQEIERLKAEIERLERVINDQNELCWGCKKSVKETAKGFAEKLKKYLYNSYNLYEDISYEEFCKANVIFGDIDKLLGEYEVEE